MADKYENNGVLFDNRDKQRETHPDRTGSINVTCPHCRKATEYWLNGWIKHGLKAGRFLSIAVKPKDIKKQAEEARNAADPSPSPEEDDVPF